ncbi:hypothetical protein EV659_10697 [Rhodothalassium salexigens DSM 2132]|uniref:Lipoprotein n=1 Tax=Rhodothalassium salexigens DSM 2132 TaxID=1188247 RepID=A0A4R2PF75_RHOSA|nr:hypothetical protein [Rhodothalassium salexigens]MBB4211763.1 hypothetical protein [Rhodothalassium salexigens DSM 2132]MBK1639628.1 hypothetical protein [Rhodothalassium salexigens DSM 2132]TCP33939.1 hypothetical protein EV659_10697 [Rhodothalassium salexigens DSM 2132]
MALRRAYPRPHRHRLWLLPFAVSFSAALGLAQCQTMPSAIGCGDDTAAVPAAGPDRPGTPVCDAARPADDYSTQSSPISR